MIAKATRGQEAGGLGRYLHGPGTRDEHHIGDGTPGGEVIGGNLAQRGDTSPGWARTMDRIIARRPDPVKGPVYQISLRTAPDDRRLTDAEWRHIAAEWMASQGCEAHPSVLVRHADDHVHLVVSRVGFDGQLWHARQDYRVNEKVCRSVERGYGLTQVADSRTARRTAAKRLEAEKRVSVATQAQKAVRSRSTATQTAGRVLVAQKETEIAQAGILRRPRLKRQLAEIEGRAEEALHVDRQKIDRLGREITHDQGEIERLRAAARPRPPSTDHLGRDLRPPGLPKLTEIKIPTWDGSATPPRPSRPRPGHTPRGQGR